MARIIYGVMGEGRGHSSRSKIIIEHLLSKGHEVKIITSRKGYAYLSQFFDDVTDIMGLSFVFKKQKIDIGKTIQKNLEKGVTRGPKTIGRLLKIFDEFNPDLAITDFEPFVPGVSYWKGVPFISINHQHLIAHCNLEYLKEWDQDFFYANAVVNNMYRFASQYFITSFYFPPIKKQFRKKTELVGPILRKEVLRQKIKDKDHILVYATTKESKAILKTLKRMDENFIAYGFGKDKRSGNITFKKPSTDGFLKDLAECKAVITNGGYSLMAEALFMGKPVYSIPINKQFEQMLNAYYLERLGYGIYDLNHSKERIQQFIEGLDYFKKNIRRDKELFNGNNDLFRMLDKKVKQFSKGK
ncbi:MJ1255/VC2487 family glycosyltransferase [Thermoproteota archaeon]